MSGCAIAAIVACVLVGIIVIGIGAAYFTLVKEGPGDTPEWAKYPHGTLISGSTMHLPGSTDETTTLQYETDDSAETVIEYYKTEIVKHGGQATATPMSVPRPGVRGTAVKDAEGKFEINVIRVAGERTGMFVHYSKNGDK